MPKNITLENNFTGGFKTEFTGLNFPENACSAVNNCIFTLTGDVTRRPGIDFEENFKYNNIFTTQSAQTTYLWRNASGDGSSTILVQQIGAILYFYLVSNATETSPLSTQFMSNFVNLNTYVISGQSVLLPTQECQYSDGNGTLFVFHPSCPPLYINYTPGAPLLNGTLATTPITVQIRDFTGIYADGTQGNYLLRPQTLTTEHNYNLQNQGWTQGTPWSGFVADVLPINFSPNVIPNTISFMLTSQSNVNVVTPGMLIRLTGQAENFGDGVIASYTLYGTVNFYNGSGGLITITTTQVQGLPTVGFTAFGPTYFDLPNVGYINTWHSDFTNYPSNSDVWWFFKDSSGAFAPITTITNVAQANAPAPKGHFVLDAWTQDRSATSGITGITVAKTSSRPSTGAFFQDRVWYSGVTGLQLPTGDLQSTQWTENIYFSQTITNNSSESGPIQYGQCYQNNDPTSQDFFDILPTDGGVITIPGTGHIYKLFPVQNGLLVFAANGIWFITGGTSIGFTATDYTITQISKIQTISGTSFIDMHGWPVWWTQDGIYTVTPSSKGGGLEVENLCLGTILSFYNNIPLQSKMTARGDYNPISYILEWTFRSTNATDTTSTYQYDSVLAINTVNRAFYLYSLPSNPSVNGVRYVAPPGGTNFDNPVFKYMVSVPSTRGVTFAEEVDTTNWVDFKSFDSVGQVFTSSFTTGPQLRGKGTVRWQPEYVTIFLRNETPSQYIINGVFDFGKTSSQAQITTFNTNFPMWYRRHRIRGRGLTFQLQIQSIAGQPFDIMGWSVYETTGSGP